MIKFLKPLLLNLSLLFRNILCKDKSIRIESTGNLEDLSFPVGLQWSHSNIISNTAFALSFKVLTAKAIFKSSYTPSQISKSTIPILKRFNSPAICISDTCWPVSSSSKL